MLRIKQNYRTLRREDSMRKRVLDMIETEARGKHDTQDLFGGHHRPVEEANTVCKVTKKPKAYAYPL